MPDSKPKNFESSLEELETIVRELEQGDLTLEKSLELFEQGVKLSRECQERLNQAERRIGGGRGALRILLVIAVVLILIIGGVLIGGFFWWRSYQTSPAYSLALLVDAAQRHDTPTIDTILDNDKVTEDFVAQVRQKTAGSYSAAINSLFSNQADSMAAKLTPKLKETVHEQIILEVQRIAAPAAGKPFFLVALFIPRFVDIKQENDVAHAVVNVKDEQIQLTMNAAEARWRVVAIQDDKLSQLVADGIKKNLSTSGTQLQDEIRKQLEKIQPTK